MKYDFSKCNNLQFKAKGDGGEVMEGYLKITKRGVIYVFYTGREDNKSFDSSIQIETRNYEHCYYDIKDFLEWAELRELEIVPRDPETYTDWKVGDKVIHNINNQVYTILAVLGEAIILSKDSGISVTALTTAESLTKYNKLVLTDYEKELLNAQKMEEKRKACPFKEGDKVLVRDSFSSWRFDVFVNYEADSCYPYECNDNEYKQCIPLNERTWKLLGTTDEYKEEE